MVEIILTFQRFSWSTGCDASDNVTVAYAFRTSTSLGCIKAVLAWGWDASRNSAPASPLFRWSRWPLEATELLATPDKRVAAQVTAKPYAPCAVLPETWPNGVKALFRT